MFSNIDFWTQWSPEFLGIFKKYVDNIIKSNLPIGNISSDTYQDCSCNNKNGSDNNHILQRLSESLSYMMVGDICGHKNYIYDALYEWSSKLYEYMIW